MSESYDVFGAYRKAEFAFIEHPSTQSFKIAENLRKKAMRTFKDAKTISGGEKIRMPLEF